MRPHTIKLQSTDKVIDLTHPQIMGVINITPDSFYDGGRTYSHEAAVRQAEKMLASGVNIIDIGGESTRPGGKKQISAQEELDRIVSTVDYVSNRLGALVSVDTSSPEVMQAAVQAGAGIINDVRALQRPGAIKVAASLDVPVILMHSLVEQPEADFVPCYDNIVSSVSGYLSERMAVCEEAGIARERIILDPGFGGGMFGKTPQHDLQLVKHFKVLHKLGRPLLAGASRKSFIGAVLEKEAEQRLYGSLAVAALLLHAGAQIIRVHDVAETRDILQMVEAVKNA